MTNEELDNAREIEAIRIYDLEQHDPKGHGVAKIAARLAREGWTPPVPVDPDRLEARKYAKSLLGTQFEIPSIQKAEDHFFSAIKRGRALAAAEAKTGMVWIKHDGARQSPVPGSLVTVRVGHSQYQTDQSFMIDWWMVSHYAIIPRPEGAA